MSVLEWTYRWFWHLQSFLWYTIEIRKEWKFWLIFVIRWNVLSYTKNPHCGNPVCTEAENTRVHGRWLQRKSSRAGIKKQFSASWKWVSIFGSWILTLSLLTNEGQVLLDYYGNVALLKSWPVCAVKERKENVSWFWSCSNISGKQSCDMQALVCWE